MLKSKLENITFGKGEWNVKSNGILEKVSSVGEGKIQYLNFKFGQYSGKTVVLLGNFNNDLVAVDVIQTDLICRKNMYYQTDDILNYYLKLSSKDLNGVILTNPLTNQTTVYAEKGIEKNNIFFDLIILGQATKTIFRIFQKVPKSRIVGGASKNSSYFTNKAIEMGYSLSKTVPRHSAGFWVQVHNNVPRLFNGLKWRVLMNTSQATTIGRQMLNSAYKKAVIQISIGGTSLYNDFK
ncbi:hypothetical protein [Tenacibaculum sp. SDUM215027]|uniref:hypothetical protein n=1 Tax=Tenacibaculum sp. SDUM215027 TaxID=3422596 RepID=UPI003D3142C6